MDKEQANSLVWEVWGMEGPDKEENFTLCDSMDGTGESYAK